MWVVSTSVSATSTPTDFRPLAGCGLFLSDPVLRGCSLPRFRPLAGCGLFLFDYGFPRLPLGFRPLAGCGLFPHDCRAVRSVSCFRPLAGCGLFLLYVDYRAGAAKFPSPCGVWVVSTICVKIDGRYIVSVPLRGVGCFFDEDVCAIFDAVSVPLRGVGCFGKAAHSFWCNRKKNCQLCYFIVSYWQMFINSKLRNCKVPCEAHKTAT